MAMATALASAPAPGELKSFGDWAVGCDNGRACKAVSLMEMETGENQLTIQIMRDPDARSAAQIRIDNIEQAEPGEMVTLILDGTASIGLTALTSDTASMVRTLDPPLFTILRQGKTLELRNGNGQSLGSASLRGLAQAIAYIDDSQGRTSSVTALAKAGQQPASLVPPPPVLPTISVMRPAKPTPMRLSSADIAELQARTGCAAADNPALPVDAVRLDRRNWLVLVPCGAGAYNFLTAPVLVAGSGKARRMKIAEFDFPPAQSSPEGTPLLVNAAWDASKSELTTFAKGRGLADCGSAETYVWDGRELRMTSQLSMDECRGVTDWIPVWRTTTARR